MKLKVNVKLIENWKQFWKIGSIYMFAFIAVLPDIWNLIIASDLMTDAVVGEKLNLTIKVVSLVGAIVRLTKTQVALANGAGKTE